MKMLRRVLAVLLVLTVLVGGLYLFWLSPQYVVPILMYHRFGYEDRNLFVTPENFKRQMQYLSDKGYNVITLDELVEGIKNDIVFEHNSVVITIDDGFEDNFTHAFPVLKEQGYPATIFVIANYMDKVVDGEAYLKWKDIREMLKHDITIGGHSKNHVYLPLVKEDDRLWDETVGCKKLIEDKLGRRINYFCYPTGAFSEKIKKLVKKAGYKAACTTNRGFVELNKDVYELKRVKVKNSDMNKPLSFRAKLSGYYNLFRSRRNPY